MKNGLEFSRGPLCDIIFNGRRVLTIIPHLLYYGKGTSLFPNINE
jgi:hypothetical protein